jgi:glycosyltransferase involved in cell wall biosynthesis
MHPSYEDRPDAPDRVFAAVDDEAYEAHVAAWSRALEEAGAADADVLHLHHLTPIHEAAARVAPDVPVVGPPPRHRAADARAHRDGRRRRWHHAEDVGAPDAPLGAALRARAAALAQPARARRAPAGHRSAALRHRAQRLRPRALRAADRRPRRVLAQTLVDDPHGWRPGTTRARSPTARAGARAGRARPCCSSVSRFTEVKRLGLLVRAFARARTRCGARRASLVLVGGYPGSGRASTLRRDPATGARDVYLAGWHEHDALPGFFAAADAVVLASVREQFGSALVEGMACGCRPIAVDRFGPADIVRPGRPGGSWHPTTRPRWPARSRRRSTHPEERRRRGDAPRAATSRRATRGRASPTACAGCSAGAADSARTRRRGADS